MGPTHTVIRCILSKSLSLGDIRRYKDLREKDISGSSEENQEKRGNKGVLNDARKNRGYY